MIIISKIKIGIGLLAMACFTMLLITVSIEAGSTESGTVNDPIVTKSYVDQRDGEVLEKINIKLAELAGGTSHNTTSTNGEIDMEAVYAYLDQKLVEEQGSVFVVVEVEEGQKLIGGAGTEIVLRGGSATIIEGVNGDGIADLTDGKDLLEGIDVPAQHHLLIAKDDGRGLMIHSKSWIMVKGDYTLE